MKQKTEKKAKDTGKESSTLTEKEKEEREKVIDNLLERTRTLLDEEGAPKVIHNSFSHIWDLLNHNSLLSDSTLLQNVMLLGALRETISYLNVCGKY